ncbi:EAL domain-containing protein [Maricaulaceae bacterium NA33B04]|nr:EAL domain-containing protein [Maricaulaceae bacterium NA33B04]
MGEAFEAAARAAGALAVEITGHAIALGGDAERLGLDQVQAIQTLAGFLDACAPGDRGALERLGFHSKIDRRVRLVGADGAVRYARLIGAPDSGTWRGLLLPAGASPDGGLAALDLETALRQALEDGDVLAHHQPVVSLETGKLAGFEALARWVRPDGSVDLPEHFLPLADEQGLIRAVGDAVRGSAIKDAAAWHAARGKSGRPLFLAANATASELCAPDFTDSLLGQIREAGLPAGTFKLEISETEVMRDPDHAEIAMKALKAGGVSLVLDDFGTGYSSLSRLDRFPFDTVKIDQYFTRAAQTDEAARSIISGVVRIARSYSMTIVAEGIETDAAAKLCAELGCDFGQGFRYAQALAPEEAANAALHGMTGRFEV